MGAYKYIEELYKKKQTDVLRFVLRIRAWEYRQLNVIHRASRPSRPDRARRLGYEAKQRMSFSVFVSVVEVARSQVRKGQVMGKPATHGVNQLKPTRSSVALLKSVVGRKCPNLRVLNSYWVEAKTPPSNTLKSSSSTPPHKAIRRDPRYNWICAATMKHRESRGLTSCRSQVSRENIVSHLYNKVQGSPSSKETGKASQCPFLLVTVNRLDNECGIIRLTAFSYSHFHFNYIKAI